MQKPTRSSNSIVSATKNTLKYSVFAIGICAATAQLATAGSLTTTFATNNGFAGNMFDVVGLLGDLTITGLDVNLDNLGASANLDVYTRTGTFVGNTGSSAGWTLVSSTSVTSAGADNPTFVDVSDFVIPGGNETTGFYVFLSDYPNASMLYTNGVGVGTVVASNSDLQILDGVGTSDILFPGFVFTPRTWNGTIYYLSGPPQGSLNLDEQQGLTPFMAVQNSYKILEGISGNLSDQFNGTSSSSGISASGFAFQSSGASGTKAGSAINNYMGASKSKGTIASRMQSYGYGTTSGGVMPNYNVWVKGSWSHYNGSGNSFSGNIGDVVGGVDYRVRDNLIIGGLLAYGNANFNTVTTGVAGGLNSVGYTVGGYLGWQIDPTWTFDAMAAWSDVDYNNRSGAVTGAFGAQRWTMGANLTGKFDYKDVVVMPTFSLVVSTEKQAAYTDSATTLHAARTVNSGRISVGPKFVFPEMQVGESSAQAWLATKAEYDFSNQSTSLTSGLPDFGNAFSGRVQAGVTMAVSQSAVLSLQGDVSGLGSGKFTGYEGSGKLRVSF